MGSDLWLEYDKFVWPMMTICVGCFVGISYATIGLENQVAFACF